MHCLLLSVVPTKGEGAKKQAMTPLQECQTKSPAKYEKAKTQKYKFISIFEDFIWIKINLKN